MNWLFKISQEGLDRINYQGPYGVETIGEWLERHKVQRTPDGRFVFYHGTPVVGGATDELREGSLLGFSEEESRHFAARDRDLGPEDVVVHTLYLRPDEIAGGHWASLRVPVDIREGSPAKVL